jgi:cytoskeletal protein RodZ
MSEKPLEAKEERPAAEAFGPWLRRQREIREIQLKEIAERTKISMRYLQAMEQDRFDLLPGPVFVRGFLREYARFVGLSPDEVVNFYLATRDQAGEGTETLEESRGRRRDEASRSRRWLALGLVAVLAVVGVAVWWLWGTDAPAVAPPEPEAAPVTIPVTEAPSEQPLPLAESASVTAPLAVTVDFSGECWVEAVVDSNERERIMQGFVQGESLQLAAQESVLFRRLGDGSVVSVQVNGRPLPIIARPGQVIRDLAIDLETARRLEEQDG